MLQNIQDKIVYVVELKTMPVTPITGVGEFEQKYASALTRALRNGQITKPGKYGIEIDWSNDMDHYNVYEIKE